MNVRCHYSDMVFIIPFYFQTDTFAAVYKKLTGKEVTFEFPEPLF